MPDREKVIKGLEICTSRPCYCTDCPYRKECCLDSQNLMEDALALLKEQEAPTVDAAPVRHGRWVKTSGYATPGGDPVWRCSECGRGIHVYGIEHGTYGLDVAVGQWVACPNCGAKMDLEEHNG